LRNLTELLVLWASDWLFTDFHRGIKGLCKGDPRRTAIMLEPKTTVHTPSLILGTRIKEIGTPKEFKRWIKIIHGLGCLL
jgi:hypothetical protein